MNTLIIFRDYKSQASGYTNKFLKNRVTENKEPTSNIFNECFSGLSESAKVIVL